MSGTTIYIGNKNYSSWSLRGWLMLERSGLEFEEVLIPLDRPETQRRIGTVSPSGRVPVLVDGGVTIWESLAIGEHLAERCPEAGLWPVGRAERARARALAAEMHAGFAALREALPMDIRARREAGPLSAAAAADIGRIEAIFEHLGAAGAGPFGCGEFGIVDAMYAPIASRFRTYGITLHGAAGRYAAALSAWPPMLRWSEAARVEPYVLESP